jgi:hypothetical protein
VSLLLQGEVDNRDDIIAALEQDNDRLQEQVSQLQSELRRSREDTARSVAGLRRELSPLYNALRRLFGEIDNLGVEDEPAPRVQPKTSAIWESWKRKLGGKPAEFIDILLEHGEMSAAQLKIAAHCGQRTVYDTIFKLNKAGLVNKNGGKFSLKQI